MEQYVLLLMYSVNHLFISTSFFIILMISSFLSHRFLLFFLLSHLRLFHPPSLFIAVLSSLSLFPSRWMCHKKVPYQHTLIPKGMKRFTVNDSQNNMRGCWSISDWRTGCSCYCTFILTWLMLGNVAPWLGFFFLKKRYQNCLVNFRRN